MFLLCLIGSLHAEPARTRGDDPVPERAGSRAGPTASQHREMLEAAESMMDAGDALSALAQIFAAGDPTGAGWDALRGTVANVMVVNALGELQGDPAGTRGLYATWASWPLSSSVSARLDAHYSEVAAALSVNSDILLLDDLALELPIDHPLPERLHQAFTVDAAGLPGRQGLYASAAARFSGESLPVALPYPQSLGMSVAASDCASLFGEGLAGDLGGAFFVEVSSCATHTEERSTVEDYTYQDVEVYEVTEEVVVGTREECHDRQYYDDNNIQKEGWTERVCEDIPITQLQRVQRSRTITRTGQRTVEHRDYVFRLTGTALASLDAVSVQRPVVVRHIVSDSSYTSLAGDKAWDPALGEASARAQAPEELRGLVHSMRGELLQAVTDDLVAQAAALGGPEGEELLIRAWWLNRRLAPKGTLLNAAQQIVERPTDAPGQGYTLPALPEAPLIIDGYGQLHDTREQSGWIVKSPGLLKLTNSGLTLGTDMRQSYVGAGWAQTLVVAIRSGGSSEYGGSDTFAFSLYGGVSTQLDTVPGAVTALRPTGWLLGFSTGGGVGNPDGQTGFVLRFRMQYEAQHDPLDGTTYRNFAFVFPDLLLLVPHTRWKLGLHLEAQWNWLGIPDFKRRQADEPIPVLHYTPISVGPALALGPV